MYLVGLHIYYKMIHDPYNVKLKLLGFFLSHIAISRKGDIPFSLSRIMLSGLLLVMVLSVRTLPNLQDVFLPVLLHTRSSVQFLLSPPISLLMLNSS